MISWKEVLFLLVPCHSFLFSLLNLATSIVPPKNDRNQNVQWLNCVLFHALPYNMVCFWALQHLLFDPRFAGEFKYLSKAVGTFSLPFLQHRVCIGRNVYKGLSMWKMVDFLIFFFFKLSCCVEFLCWSIHALLQGFPWTQSIACCSMPYALLICPQKGKPYSGPATTNA